MHQRHMGEFSSWKRPWKTHSLWREGVGDCGRDGTHVWASVSEEGSLLDLSCLAPIWSCRTGDSEQAAQALPILDPARHPNSRGGNSFGGSLGIILESGEGALQPWGLTACRAVGRWWPWGHMSTSGSRGCGTLQPNSSALTQILPEHSFFGLGWPCNQHPLRGHPATMAHC